MRLALIGLAMAGLAAATAGCVPANTVGGGRQPIVTVARVDPQDAADRMVIGTVAGATAGAAIGAIVSINPGLGATVGTEAGGALGAIIGHATAQPLPNYKPIAVPAAAVIPEFYDSWPPGYGPPASVSEAPPPPG